MAIGAGSLLEVTLVQAFLGNAQVLNVFQYAVGGSFGTVSAANWGEAWWNHVKTPMRAICSANASPFRAVRVREMEDPVGAYGEFGIPTGEWAGTRTPPAGDWLPMFVGAGVRLSVATRVTRPGQKRFSYLTEADCDGTLLLTAYSTLLNTLMTTLAANMVLGAPALAAELQPVVVRKDPTTGLPTASQPVTGYIISNNVTSQVSRKAGRGA